MRIEVERADINAGGTGPNNCPVALAFKRNGLYEVRVGRHSVTVPWGTYSLPEEAVAFIKAYMFGPKSKVKPFGCEVRLMSWL